MERLTRKFLPVGKWRSQGTLRTLGIHCYTAMTLETAGNTRFILKAYFSTTKTTPILTVLTAEEHAHRRTVAVQLDTRACFKSYKHPGQTCTKKRHLGYETMPKATCRFALNTLIPVKLFFLTQQNACLKQTSPSSEA